MPYRSVPILLGALLAACEARVDIDLATTDLDGLSEVNVRLEGVDLLDADGDLHSLDANQDAPVELRALAGGQTLTLIESAEVDEGHYTGLRLRFADSGHEVVRDDGTRETLTPESVESFADIDLDVDEDQTASLVATLELRFSLQREDDGEYTLHQVLHAVEADRAASVGGSLDPAEVESSDCTQDRDVGTGVAVYLFPQGLDSPTDYVDGRSGPIASARVSATGTGYGFDLPYLHAGTYTLAWTCEADDDLRASDETLDFHDAVSVTVDEGEAEIVDF